MFKQKEYERTENRQSQRNGYYERSFTTRVGTLELKSTQNT
ncbi:transposase [Staphylococcus aureus]